MKIYLVGGAVRDSLLGLPVHERDWVVVGSSPEEMVALGFKPVGKDFPVFLHPKTHEEYALARTERKQGLGYKGFICYTDPTVTLEEDLIRRDLTINAMAQDEHGTVIDPYGGRADLSARLLRHVSAAFAEDPLRVLRVARFSARLATKGFTVAEETLAFMQKMSDSGELAELTPERIGMELNKALATDQPLLFFKTLKACSALERIFPDLLTEKRDLSPAGETALSHAVALSQEPALRLSALLHDLSPNQIKNFCHSFKSPAHYRDLALLVAKFHNTLLSLPLQDNASLLSWLESLDTLRRPERLSQLAIAMRAIYPHALDQVEKILAKMQQAHQVILSLDKSDLLAQGLTGLAFAQALREKKLIAIEQMVVTESDPSSS